MNRFRELLGWRLGEFGFCALLGGWGLAEGYTNGRLYDVVNGIGLVLMGSIYLLRPVRFYLNRPLGESVRESMRLAQTAAIGPAGLVLTLGGLFLACTVVSLILRFHSV